MEKPNQAIVKSIKKYATPIRSIMRSGANEESVKEYIIWEAEFDMNRLPTVETKYFDNGQIEEVHQYEYNEKGNTLLHKITIPGEGIEESFITERDAIGNPIKITKMYADEQGEITQYVYSENGKPIQIDQYDADGEHEQTEWISYDDKGNAIKKHVKNYQDEAESFYVFSYNDKELLVLQEEQDSLGKTVGTLTFDFDNEGKEINSKQTNETNKVIAEINSIYNELGKLIRRESQSFYVRISEYEYDERGNLLEESLSEENGFVITRSRYVYDDKDMVIEETLYETDLTRAGRDTHIVHRFEYSFQE